MYKNWLWRFESESVSYLDESGGNDWWKTNVELLLYVSLIFLLPSIDHSILLHRLSSRFGFDGTVMSWLTSYLSFRSFVVSILLHRLSSWYGFDGTVMSWLTSYLSSRSLLFHHLFADDTELFISFRAPEFSANIIHLRNTIDFVSQWMSANLLSLNQFKTEFLLIGLPTQLSKISDPSLLTELTDVVWSSERLCIYGFMALISSNVTITPVQSARNLGVIFDSTLSMSDLNLASYLFAIFEG